MKGRAVRFAVCAVLGLMNLLFAAWMAGQGDRWERVFFGLVSVVTMGAWNTFWIPRLFPARNYPGRPPEFRPASPAGDILKDLAYLFRGETQAELELSATFVRKRISKMRQRKLSKRLIFAARISLTTNAIVRILWDAWWRMVASALKKLPLIEQLRKLFGRLGGPGAI